MWCERGFALPEKYRPPIPGRDCPFGPCGCLFSPKIQEFCEWAMLSDLRARSKNPEADWCFSCCNRSAFSLKDSEEVQCWVRAEIFWWKVVQFLYAKNKSCSDDFSSEGAVISVNHSFPSVAVRFKCVAHVDVFLLFTLWKLFVPSHKCQTGGPS